jgi:hypothetical protein
MRCLLFSVSFETLVRALCAFSSTKFYQMPRPEEDDDVPVKKDAADKKAEEYMDGQHDRAGKKSGQPSGNVKPSSVRS